MPAADWHAFLATNTGSAMLARCLSLSLLLSCITAPAASAVEWMVQADLHGERLEGKPLYMAADRTQLLLRDGQVREFPTTEARNVRKTSPKFRPYSAGELRNRLAAEFGREFEVTGTGHYLVVHPRGKRDLWAERFEDLYRSFRHYFAVRGIRLEEPEFPLVAVVWEDQAQFRAHALREGAQTNSNTLGYYSPKTNRVSLYDTTSGGADWTQNADTIIHEVTHQTAFNTGVHARFGNTPRWLAEGLATMFEPRGVWNSAQHRSRNDRINQGRLRDFQHYVEHGHREGDLAQMIESDRFFTADSSRGYALAWALSFYLVETQPRRYADYLAKTAARDGTQPYPSAARLKDFTDVFGTNLRLLEAQFLRYMSGWR